MRTAFNLALLSGRLWRASCTSALLGKGRSTSCVLAALTALSFHLLQSWGVPRPGGLLVSGPAGSGKSALLAAAARALRAHPQCLTHTVVVRCREVGPEGAGHAQALVSAKVRQQCRRGLK